MKEKIIKIIKRIIIDIVIIFWGLFLVSLFLFTPGNFNHKLPEARDTTVISEWKIIDSYLSKMKNYNFTNYLDFQENNKLPRAVKNCYYLSATQDKKDYIFVQPLESKKYQKKMWGEFILHMSNPNYLITEERWKEIQRVISHSCNFEYQKTDQ